MVNFITNGNDKFCEQHGHIKHDDFDFCILCHEETKHISKAWMKGINRDEKI